MAADPEQPPPPYIAWEQLRDAYLSRFGPLFDSEPRYDFQDDDPLDDALSDAAAEPGDGAPEIALTERDLARIKAAEAVYFQLQLGAIESDPHIVYATFGAGPRTGGHEVFLASAMPFWPFQWLLEDKALTGVALAPGLVLDLPIHDTPFTALLLAPADAGSLIFRSPRGRDAYALRVIPLTAPERALAAVSLADLVRGLRRGGVLDVVDPLRDCTLSPRRTRSFWAFARPDLLEATRRTIARALADHDEMVASRASGEDLTLVLQTLALARATQRHLEARQPDPTSPEERFASHVRGNDPLVLRVLTEATRSFPAARGTAWRIAMAEIVGVTLQSHPVAQQFIALAGGIALPSDFDAERLVQWVAAWIERFHPTADLEAIVGAGRSGARVATTERLTADGAVAPSEAWKTVLWAMYLQLYLPDNPDEANEDKLLKAVYGGIGVGADIFQTVDDVPAADRLADVARMIVLHMLVVLHDVPLDLPPKPKAGARRGPKPGLH